MQRLQAVLNTQERLKTTLKNNEQIQQVLHQNTFHSRNRDGADDKAEFDLIHGRQGNGRQGPVRLGATQEYSTKDGVASGRRQHIQRRNNFVAGGTAGAQLVEERRFVQLPLQGTAQLSEASKWKQQQQRAHDEMKLVTFSDFVDD